MKINAVKKMNCKGPCSFEPVTSNIGSLADGTTYTVTGADFIDADGNIAQSQNNPPISLVFSQEVDLIITNVTVGNPNSTPYTWNGAGGSLAPVNVTADNGCFTFDLINSNLISNLNVISENNFELFGNNVPTASDWGEIKINDITQLSIDVPNAGGGDSYRILVRPIGLCEQSICDSIINLNEKIDDIKIPTGEDNSISKLTPTIDEDCRFEIAEHDDGNGNIQSVFETRRVYARYPILANPNINNVGGALNDLTYDSANIISDASDFTASSNQIRVTKSGDYDVSVITNWFDDNSARVAHRVILNINGSEYSRSEPSNYMRDASGQDEGNTSYRDFISLSSGDLITVQVQNTTLLGGTSSLLGTSRLIIERLNNG